jgi:hypothetical protein
MFHLPIITRFAGSSSYPAAIAVTAAAAVPVFRALSYSLAAGAGTPPAGPVTPGRALRFPAGRALASFSLFLASLALVCGLLLSLAALRPREWIFVYLAFPLFVLAVPAAGRLERRRGAPRLPGPAGLRLALLLAPPAALLLYALLSPAVSPPEAYPDAAAAVAARGALFPGTGSAFLKALGAWRATLGGLTDSLPAPALAIPFAAWLAQALLPVALMFYGLGALAAYAFIPRPALRRLPAGPDGPRPVAGPLFQAALPAYAAAVLFAAGAFALEARFAPGRGAPGSRGSG